MSATDLPTLVDNLAQKIADRVIGGDLPPGSKLEEQALADQFEVSRTPVREALRQLASSGLIELRPNRGAFVARVTPQQLDEMFIAMAELEATCARLAAMSMSPLERRNLQRLHERMAEQMRQNAMEDFIESNDAFHRMIYEGAHNNVLSDMTLALRRRLMPYRRAQFRTEGRLARSHAEHDSVVKAVITGDPAGAHAAMLHHVDLVEASFEKLAMRLGPSI
ncbi:MAG: GntR family transcriptional regulator [Caulobacterales bacterium]